MNIFEEPGVGFLITDVARILRRAFSEGMETSELTLAQARALVYVARNPGIRQKELADLLEVQPITLARLIDQLQESGLVERRADPEDRRAHRLYQQPAANPHLKEIERVILQIRDRAFKQLSDEEKTVLFSALRKMRDNLSEKQSHHD